jgi:hypothetical protein
VWAADDPSWTENQLAAVQAVDAYNVVRYDLIADPLNADLMRLLDVVVEPQYMTDVTAIVGASNNDSAMVGGPPVAVWRQVGAEQTVDGRQEIQVRHCEERPEGMVIVHAGEIVEWTSPARLQNVYLVQWQEDPGRWMVALYEETGATC